MIVIHNPTLQYLLIGLPLLLKSVSSILQTAAVISMGFQLVSENSRAFAGALRFIMAKIFQLIGSAFSGLIYDYMEIALPAYMVILFIMLFLVVRIRELYHTLYPSLKRYELAKSQL